MDMYTATEEAYKRGYEAAEREYKQKLTRAGETIQELSDQLMDLDSRKSDLEKWREALPHLDICPLCGTELQPMFGVMHTVRTGDFLPPGATADQIAMRKQRVMRRMWQNLKEYIDVSDGIVLPNRAVMITANLTIFDRRKKRERQG
jgi:hypothetical protein